MKFEMQNGWREAPHCWPHFLARPLWFDWYGARGSMNISVEIVGFVICILL